MQFLLSIIKAATCQTHCIKYIICYFRNLQYVPQVLSKMMLFLHVHIIILGSQNNHYAFNTMFQHKQVQFLELNPNNNFNILFILHTHAHTCELLCKSICLN